MVTEATTQQRIAIGLDALIASVEDLPEIVEEWKQLAEGERVSWSLDWAHLMADYLTELHEYYRADQMALNQRARYLDLLRKLKEAMPLIERLNLYRPPVAPKP